MSRRNLPGTFWPSALQEQLLTVALGDPAAAVATWETLAPRFALDDLERGSFELLPLIYRNLTRGGGEDPVLPRLKGIYRKTWVANNLLVERTKETGEALRTGRIPALFVEGAVIAERFYPELGLRPTSSVDVLVEDPDCTRALVQLADTGWRERPGSVKGSGAIRYLSDEGGNVLVLRTTLAIDFVARAGGARSHTPLWEAAEQRTIGGVELLVPAPTDTLLAVCVSHARAGGGPSTQWIADAKMLLDTEIDWERLLAIGVERGQTSRLRDVFRYLASLPGARPPQSVSERLAGTRTTSRERFIYRCTAGSIRRPGALPSLAAEHLAATRDESWLRTIVTFPRHLRDRWNLSRSWHVPFAAGRRTIRLLAARRRGSA